MKEISLPMLALYIVGALVGLGVALAIYFMPSLIAEDRNHPNGSAIKIVNLFLGWTLLGWVVALAWSVNGPAGPPRPRTVKAKHGTTSRGLKIPVKP